MGPLRPTHPSDHVAGYLARNEHVVLEMKQHWARVLPAVASCVAGLVLVIIAGFAAPAWMGSLTNAAWWIWLVLLGHLLYRLVEWWDETFVITNKRLILVHGIVVKKVAMMPLSKVTDMSYNRSVAARLLGYGTFVMESAGQDQALDVIDYVRDPDERYREICGLIFGADDEDATGPHHAPHDARRDDDFDGFDDFDASGFDDQHSTYPGDDDAHRRRGWLGQRRHHDDPYDVESDSDVEAHSDGAGAHHVDDYTVGDGPLWHAEVTHGRGHHGSRSWHERPVDDTDPYGIVTVPLSIPHRDDDPPYRHAHDSDEGFDDWNDDSAWTVSREHATSPQPVRRAHHAEPRSTWWDET